MFTKEHIDQLKKRLQQPLPGAAAHGLMASSSRKMQFTAPDTARLSAVLGLFFPDGDELNLLLIKRVEDGKVHGGQISFPGGRKDPEDKDLQATALRETWEEVGISSSDIEIIGGLSSLYIPVSNSNVFPYIGYTTSKPSYILSEHEVQYTIETPISKLLQADIKTVSEIRPSAYPNMVIKAPAYQLDEQHLIWGATAMIISELEVVLSDIHT